jgi:dodecin
VAASGASRGDLRSRRARATTTSPEVGTRNPERDEQEERVAVVKIIELVGSSKTSSDDAAMQALKQAQTSLRNIRAVDIVSTGIRGENLDEYRAHVRVAFLVEGTEVD